MCLVNNHTVRLMSLKLENAGGTRNPLTAINKLVARLVQATATLASLKWNKIFPINVESLKPVRETVVCPRDGSQSAWCAVLEAGLRKRHRSSIAGLPEPVFRSQ